MLIILAKKKSEKHYLDILCSINSFNDFYRNLLIISCILIFILNTYSNIIIFMNKRIKMLNSFQMLKKYYE